MQLIDLKPDPKEDRENRKRWGCSIFGIHIKCFLKEDEDGGWVGGEGGVRGGGPMMGSKMMDQIDGFYKSIEL